MKNPRYKVTWWPDMTKDETVSVHVNTFSEALEIIPHGPPGWQRYRITQGNRFVERGDTFGPRGMPASERR